MPTLHLDVKLIQGDAVELRSFWENPNDYDDRTLSLLEIEALIRQVEEGYYAAPRSPEDLAMTGQRLWRWLKKQWRSRLITASITAWPNRRSY